VAVVNDELITMRELNKTLEVFESRIKMQGYSAEKERQLMYELRLDMLNTMINDKLTEQEIRRLDITVSKAEIDNAVKRLKNANFYTDEQLREVLARDGMTMEDLHRKIKDQILRRHLIDQEVKSKVVITKEEIERYYNRHLPEYGAVPSYHLRNIVMSVYPGADEYQKQQVLQQMQRIYDRLKEGASFAGLARQYSQSLLASEGGDLGRFKRDELSQQIQRALDGKKAGEFTAVLDTEQGYQIFYIEKIEMQSPRPLEAVSAEISEKLYNEILDQKFESWLIELRKRSYIKIME
jgi:peptidyl-prolyl cis-trans isomerase SurA